MEQTIQITALCVTAALLALVVKRGTPEIALLLALAAAVTAMLFVGQALSDVLAFLRELGERSGVPASLLVPLYKTAAIAMVVKIGSTLCADAGESALGAVVETAGAVCALATALPLLQSVLALLMEMMA